jgi:protein gp37
MPTKIEWCDETINPIRTADGGYHCTKVSEGCQNCYAERMNKRFGNGKPFDHTPTEFVLDEKQLDKPLHWKKPRMIFVCSMGDLFHEDVPHSAIQKVLYRVRMAKQHTFLILTKRPDRMRAFFMQYYVQGFIPNLWLGVTAENQKRADERIPILLQIPAAVRFVSVEPMLGPVDLLSNDYLGGCINCEVCLDNPGTCVNCAQNRKLDWIICGCETGRGARPTNIEWIRGLKNQCVAAGVPFFLKQMEVNGKVVKMPELDGQRLEGRP